MGRVIKKALLQVSDFHFLYPSHSLPPIPPSSAAFSPVFFISYLRSYPAISHIPISSAAQYCGLIAAAGKSPEATE